MKTIFAFSIILQIFISSFSQKFTTLRGKIVDSELENPLPGATIFVENTSPILATVSDTDGNFKIENVPIGRQNIQVTYIGYLTYRSENILFSANKETNLVIKLEETANNLEEVVIKSQFKKSETNNQIAIVSARSFSIEETERYAGSISDPARMAANFAGISTICDQRNDIVIRGNSPLGVLWRLDGIEIPNPNHFSSFGASGGPISILNNNLLTNSDFFTGAFPAEFGNALSGVFDLKMRNGNNFKSEHIIQIGMNGFEIGTEGPFFKKKGSFIINYRYSTLAVVDAMGFKVGIDAIPFFQDASFKIVFPDSKIGKFSLIGIGGYSFVQDFDSKRDTVDWLNSKSPENYYFGSGMGAIGLTNKININKIIKIENSISTSFIISHINKDTFSFNYPNPTAFYRQISSEKGLTLSSSFKFKFNPKNYLNLGISYQFLNFIFVDSIFFRGSFITNVKENGNYSLLKCFTQYQFKFTDLTNFYIGLHYILFTFNNSYSIEPRLGLKIGLSNKHSLHFGFGLHSQLSPRMFYIVRSEQNNSNFDEMNQKLGFSKSFHTVVGYNWLITFNLRIKTEIYYQYLFNIPVKESLSHFSMLNFGSDFFNHLPIIDSLENKGKGRNYGCEITFEKFFSNSYYWLVTASLYESKYSGFDGIERNTAFNGNFILNILAGKEFFISKVNFLNINLKLTYAGSLRYIPFEVKQIAPNYFIQMFDYNNAYLNRRNDYFRLNGRFGYKLNLKKISCELAIDFMNITNHKDIFMEYFNSTTGQMKYSYQFSFLPIIFIRFQF